MHIFSEQQGCCYVASSGCSTAARVSASPLHLHYRHLCIDDCAAQSLLRHPSAQGLCLADWVFVIELPLPASSLRPARLRVFSHIVSSSSSTTTRLGPSPLYARYWQHRRVLSSPMRCWIWQIQLRLGAQADCIDFGINPPVLTPSASIVLSPFFYVYDGPDCVDFGIAPSHNDCLDASLSSPWRPMCACSSVDTVTRPHLRRPRPSSARHLQPRLLGPHARLPQHQHKDLPPCMRTYRFLLQPQHTLHIDCYDCGGMLAC